MFPSRQAWVSLFIAHFDVSALRVEGVDDGVCRCGCAGQGNARHRMGLLGPALFNHLVLGREAIYQRPAIGHAAVSLGQPYKHCHGLLGQPLCQR
jgi:hypothetical protein